MSDFWWGVLACLFVQVLIGLALFAVAARHIGDQRRDETDEAGA